MARQELNTTAKEICEIKSSNFFHQQTLDVFQRSMFNISMNISCHIRGQICILGCVNVRKMQNSKTKKKIAECKIKFCKIQNVKLCLGLCVSIELPLVTSQPVVQPTEEEVFDPSLNRFTAWCFYSCMICKVGGEAP